MIIKVGFISAVIFYPFHSKIEAKEIHMASRSEFISFDPHMGYDELSYSSLNAICNHLVTIKNSKTYDYIPDFSESFYYSNNNKTITFNLVQDHYFHDGRHVTADDVVASLNRVTSPILNSPGSAFFSMIVGYDDYKSFKTSKLSGVKKIDKYTIQIDITRPSESFMHALTTNFGCILPWDTPLNLITDPIGSGPFKLLGINNKGQVHFKRADKQLQKYIFSNITDFFIHLKVSSEDAIIGFENGTYDIIGDDLPWVLTYPPELRNLNDKTPSIESINTTYLSLNTQIYPFNNIYLRQAMNFAINRNKIIKEMVSISKATTQIIPPSFPEYVPMKEKYYYSPKRARELIKIAGISDEFNIELYAVDSDLNKKLIQSIIKDLEAINIHVTPYFFSHKAILKIASDPKNGQVIFSEGLGWTADYLDASNFYFPLFSKEARKNKGWNWSQYINEELELEAIAADSLVGHDNNTRVTAWKKVFDKIEDEAPWVPLYNRGTMYTFSNSIIDNNLSLTLKNREIWQQPITLRFLTNIE